MALTQDDFVGAVARLNDLTRRQVIKWRACGTPQRNQDPNLSTAIAAAFGGQFIPRLSFEATYEGRILRITEYENEMIVLSRRPYKYILDVRDEDGNVTFEFPDVEGISDLFRSVQTQKLDIEGFIKKLVAG
jgi:hypothetical protein